MIRRHPESLVPQIGAERLHLLHRQRVDDAGFVLEVGGQERVELCSALILGFGFGADLKEDTNLTR